ncbi:MAG: FAD-dependent oxidoreductase [Desulfobacteraceae bacterium]|nr:MAG: FAD-dependent oxidoreductase [Desulfobacteraceae bacterium]
MANASSRPAQKKVREPAREVDVVSESDVVVVGGGPAGVGAALSAARTGARTVLLERYGHLGGMATGGLVILIPHLSDGSERRQITGICQEMIERLDVEGAAVHPRYEELGSTDPKLIAKWKEHLFFVVGGKVRMSVLVDPEILKCVLNDMMEEAGVKLFLHSWSTRAYVEEDAVRGIIFESKTGRQAILSKVVVDATGDGDIFADAGAPFDGQLDPKARISRLALVFQIANVDTERFSRFMSEEQQTYAELMYKLESLGGFSLILRGYRDDVVWVNNYFPKWVPNYMNSFVTETSGEDAQNRFLSALNFEDLTWVEVHARKGMRTTHDFLKRNVPGFGKSFIMNVAPQIGTRGSRRLLGEYVVTEKDIRTGTVFNDSIALCPPIDGNVSPEHPHMCIPYRALLPKKVQNLLVAGRCFSSDLVANDVLNIIPFCIAMGQAAGTAASIAAKADLSPGNIDVDTLQRGLIDQNVVLPEAIKQNAGAGKTSDKVGGKD